jgi:hypothetical protein
LSGTQPVDGAVPAAAFIVFTFCDIIFFTSLSLTTAFQTFDLKQGKPGANRPSPIAFSKHRQKKTAGLNRLMWI